MINILKNFFEDNNKLKKDDINDLEILCGLMIEAANSDGNIDNIEIEKINNSLIKFLKKMKNRFKVFWKWQLKTKTILNHYFFIHLK